MNAHSNEKNLTKTASRPVEGKRPLLFTADSPVSRPFGCGIDNFYITDFISETSAIMAKATAVRIKNTFYKEKSLYN